VSNERLDAAGTAAENLAAFRLVDDEWQRLETSVAEETDAGVVLEAQTPGFSVFAVSAVEPPTGEITLNPETVTAGEAVSLSGAQSTDPDGEIEAYEWSVDGETLTGETVTTSLDAPGEYTVELVVTDDAGETDTVTATLVVEQAETATPEPEPDADTPEPDVESPTEGPVEEPGGFDILPVAVVAVVLLLGAGYVAYRRRER
jgi:PKD repeat protein